MVLYHLKCGRENVQVMLLFLYWLAILVLFRILKLTNVWKLRCKHRLSLAWSLMVRTSKIDVIEAKACNRQYNAWVYYFYVLNKMMIFRVNKNQRALLGIIDSMNFNYITSLAYFVSFSCLHDIQVFHHMLWMRARWCWYSPFYV